MGDHSGDIDIYTGLSPAFIDQIKRYATKASSSRGGVLFRQGDAASHFYTLLKGRVAFCIGKGDNVVYKVQNQGQAFGWSSLIGGGEYATSAVCVPGTAVLKYDGNKLKAFLAGKPAKALRFYLNLSRAMDNRLIQTRGLLALVAEKAKGATEQEGLVHDHFDLLS